MKNPKLLESLLEKLGELGAPEGSRAEWAQNPCTVLLQQELLHQLHDVWGRILNAKSWDEFVALRGQYAALLQLVDLPQDLIEDTSTPVSTPDDFAAMQTTIEESAQHGNE